MRLLHKSEGCLLSGESDESDKDVMLKSVGGVADFIWKQSRRSLRLRRLSSPASVFKDALENLEKQVGFRVSV